MANKIKILRVIKGLNQQELAASVGVTQGAVSQWENGASQPSSKIVPKLADILGCSPEELIDSNSTEKCTIPM